MLRIASSCRVNRQVDAFCSSASSPADFTWRIASMPGRRPSLWRLRHRAVERLRCVGEVRIAVFNFAAEGRCKPFA